MKTAFLNFRKCENNDPSKENFERVGGNSGNIVFCNSLQNMIRCESVTTQDLMERASEFDSLVVRDFITIKEGADLAWFQKILKAFKNKVIVPISVGLQAVEMKPDFMLHENAVRILSEIAERAILGIRGEYTAFILNKHGIKNIRVVGCPSMYFQGNYNRTVIKKDFKDVKNIISNYKTISNRSDNALDISIIDFLSKNTGAFVEQTPFYAGSEVSNGSLKKYLNFLRNNRKLFFNFDEWYRFVKKYDFCIGGRFHGNVVAVLAGVPALFLTQDSRTKEMTDFYEFPTIAINNFDTSKSMEYYYDMADYTNFNKNYAKKLDNFIDFCLQNNLEVNHGFQQYMYRKITEKNRLILKLKEENENQREIVLNMKNQNAVQQQSLDEQKEMCILQQEHTHVLENRGLL